MKHLDFRILILLIFAFNFIRAQVPYAPTPTWESKDVSDYSTGTAWADINKDGWLDLVIANGNDMARQRVVVYLNKDGTLPDTASWQSADIDYHGHLAVGDINNDGYPDVAVSVYIGESGFSQRGKVKLYFNRNGTLESSPSWVSQDTFSTFSCAFGDADGDGDLDLAVACGESYFSRPERNRIYYNRGGRLDSLPGWTAAEASYSYDVGWVDFDKDGRLDLIFANEGAPNRIYKNYGDSIGTAPVWSSTDEDQNANSLAIGDVNNDGYLDVVISDNNQLGGTGRFKIYLNNSGTLDTIPWWTSAWSGYGSGIALADIDRDGDKDLVTGGWWQPCRIYLNQGGGFTQDPQWTSAMSSVVEAIVFADYNNDGLDTIDTQFISDGSTKLYYLQSSPLQSIISVLWNGDADTVSPWCYDLENGWISFNTPASPGTIIDIRSITSGSLDFVVSNWDKTIGNYVFRNTLPPVFVSDESETPSGLELSQNSPNPFNPVTSLTYELPNESNVSLIVYDLLGKEIARLAEGNKSAGIHSVIWDASGFGSGIYFYHFEAVSVQNRKASYIQTGKMVLVK
jgi:FG-GAP-like repeat